MGLSEEMARGRKAKEEHLTLTIRKLLNYSRKNIKKGWI
jgi:hypothetical protein